MQGLGFVIVAIISFVGLILLQQRLQEVSARRAATRFACGLRALVDGLKQSADVMLLSGDARADFDGHVTSASADIDAFEASVQANVYKTLEHQQILKRIAESYQKASAVIGLDTTDGGLLAGLPPGPEWTPEKG